MKAPIASILIFATASVSLAQDSILFANVEGGVDAPITNAAGQRIVGPSSYVADLFWSTDTNARMDSLRAAGFNTQFSTYPGYFLGGGKDLGVGIVLVLCQVRVWDTSYGATYQEARDRGGEFGFSNLITILPDYPPGPETVLNGLEGFQLQRLPQLASTLSTTNTIVLSWPVEGTAYLVQQNPDLSPNNWVTLQNSPITVGQKQQVTVPVPPTGRMFYRLVSQ